MAASKLEPNVWYVDPDNDQRFKIVKVEKQTVEVIDTNGNRRMLNRIMCEAAFVRERTRRHDET